MHEASIQNDQLNGLLALKIVAEKKSFTLAAQSMGITPSAVSQIIKQLETKLGVALLARTSRSISLTEAGEQFLNQIGSSLDQILHAVDEVGNYAAKPSGLLRINAPRLSYHSFLQPLLKNFTDAFPDITLEIFFEDARSDVVESGFDAGIRLSDVLAKDMVAIKLFGPVNFITAAAPSYLEKMGRPKHPKDLLTHKCIRGRMGSGMYDRWDFEQNGKEFQVQVKGPMILNDSILMIDFAVDGHGVIYTTEDVLRSKVEEGKLEIILEKFKSTSTGYYLYYPNRSQVLPKLRAFIDFMKNNK